MFDCRDIASIWTLRLFNSCCDICKDLGLEILAIYCSNMQLGYSIFALLEFKKH
jgi:hypothetical protein